MNRIILAGVNLRENRKHFDSAMAETEELCKACGMEVVGTVTQQSESMNPHTAFRKGKLEELSAAVKELDADGVVFYNPLRVAMAEKISASAGVDVIDRTAVILNIFSSRARSAQAKLQTEMARLKYDLPRVLNETTEASQHSRGSFNNRGAGEMRSAMIERKFADRIALLKRELKKIEGQQDMDEKRRSKTLLKKAALVGYTNAGKSSFLNAMIDRSSSQGTKTFEEDMLFATLDTSVRKITNNGRAYFLYDTVGFVSDLPHELVEAFKSTLQAAVNADLLIHVVDASDPDYIEKMQITKDTLQKIGAGDIPMITVYNKIDKTEDRDAFTGITTSCKTHEGLETAEQKILEKLYPEEVNGNYLIPYGKISLFDTYKPVVNSKILDHTEEGMLVYLSGSKEYMNAFAGYRVN